VNFSSSIPMLTDHSAWVGNLFWTPDVSARDADVRLLFSGVVTPAIARRLILPTHTRAVVEPCQWSGRLDRVLPQLGFRTQSVGCARVFLRPAAPRGGDAGRG
jgi:hypothetical protein